jgi:hypothetical protein
MKAQDMTQRHRKFKRAWTMPRKPSASSGVEKMPGAMV